MDRVELAEDAIVSLTYDNLCLLSSSIGESLEALDEQAFALRIGVEKKEAYRRIDRLNKIVVRMSK